MPPSGGDTCFANMYAAFDALERCREGETRQGAGDPQLGAVTAEARSDGNTGGDRRRAADEPSACARASGYRAEMPVHGRACFTFRRASDGGRARTPRRAGSACDGGAVLIATSGVGRPADVGQPLPAAPSRCQLRCGALSTGSAPHLPAGDCAGVDRLAPHPNPAPLPGRASVVPLYRAAGAREGVPPTLHALHPARRISRSGSGTAGNGGGNAPVVRRQPHPERTEILVSRGL